MAIDPKNRQGEESSRSLTIRCAPGQPSFIISGRSAQTLELLIATGARGFTSGEASPLGWARRTSHYIHLLRKKGLTIITTPEKVGDALVGRYTLAGPVVVLARGPK